MKKIRNSGIRKQLHQWLRGVFGHLPKAFRFSLLRRMVSCDLEPDERLVLKIAETQEELTACFRLLHDAYVGSGFMKPEASGMRVTMYHALPTTTTLCAKFDGRVVGTISMIREGVFGFPLQGIFDLEQVRAKGGNIAEISALAVHPEFRRTGGAILFPLMKFMHEYCTNFFDTRHLVIAVNPEKIELYEALLFFERLQENVVDRYDFANGAPAVGATLDLLHAADRFRAGYAGRPSNRSLYKYFFDFKLPNIQWPQRRYFTTNDPVMTPPLLDHFFNRQSSVFSHLDDRKKSLLWSIYDAIEYRSFLPMLVEAGKSKDGLRRHRRYSMRCPGQLVVETNTGRQTFVLDVIEISFSGFQAESKLTIPLNTGGIAVIELGQHEQSRVHATPVRERQTEAGLFYGFQIDEPDPAWRVCVSAFEMGNTYRDLV